MVNRTFKVKVVSQVLEVMRTWFELKLKRDQRFTGLTLVLDYRGVPAVVHEPGASRGSSVQQLVEERCWASEAGRIGCGECDIKAFSWLPLARCLCIVSINCDYPTLADAGVGGRACAGGAGGAGGES
jgi:hypothetical protein